MQLGNPNPRIVCYTAITGNYDRIYDPIVISPGVDYICFTDNRFAKSARWQIRKIPEDLYFLSNVKQQRVLKICPHRYLRDYDISVWVDGNIQITGDIYKFVSEYDLAKTSLYTRVHPCRNCVYDEADAILKTGKDTAENIIPIVERYKAEGYPKNIGMAETCIMLRAHNEPACRLFDEAWASELLLHSHRDQMSFNYVAWKRRFLPGYLSGQFKINDNEYFRMMRHG